VLLARTPATGALHNYTDHIRHPAYAYGFLEFGPSVYRMPTGQLVQQSAFRHKIPDWPITRYLYPPGALVIFLPLALVGQWTPVSTGTFARLAGVYVAALVHLGLWFALLRVRRLPRGWSIAAGLLLWAYCLRAALNGQYEPLWFVPASLMLSQLEMNRPRPALGWLAGAWLIHYRAVVLLPFGLVAAARVLGDRREGDRRWLWIFLPSAAGALAAVTFLVAAAAPFRVETPLYAMSDHTLVWIDIVATLAGAAIATGIAADWALATAIFIIGATGLVDVAHWWHASAVFLPFLAQDAVTRWKRPALVTPCLIVWSVVMHYVWLDRPAAILGDLRTAVRLAAVVPSASEAVGKHLGSSDTVAAGRAAGPAPARVAGLPRAHLTS
jgi:hypothetical protein